MTFAGKLIRWQRRHGRNGLPWQGTRDPYRVWLSEVMLQQTQVSAVIPYYERFLTHYPSVQALAAASEDEVLRLWSGLGYYARGRNLHKAAKVIAALGRFPDTPQALERLPGVGRSTAGAIAAFAFGRRAAILDGNAKRVLSRCFGLADTKALWARAEQLLPRKGIEAYTQGLMDLGATVCTRRRPGCDACPVHRQCIARKDKRMHELPAPRARQPLPEKRATWLVLLCRGAVLLERRPSPGLWGGLWTFPEAEIACRRRKGRTLALIEHGFTHFRLLARPVLYRLRKPIASPGRRWLPLAEAAQAAVPTPVRRLLHALQAELSAERFS